jgi:hypothetical protein
MAGCSASKAGIGFRGTMSARDGRAGSKIPTAIVISLLEDMETLGTEVRPAGNGR